MWSSPLCIYKDKAFHLLLFKATFLDHFSSFELYNVSFAKKKAFGHPIVTKLQSSGSSERTVGSFGPVV